MGSLLLEGLEVRVPVDYLGFCWLLLLAGLLLLPVLAPGFGHGQYVSG